MKRTILLLAAAFFAAGAYAQEWKLAPVWTDIMTSVYISYGYPDEESGSQGEDFFTMWGYKTYTDEGYNPFEVEYFRGSPSQTGNFLKGVRDFAERNMSGMALAVIEGVRVKTFNQPITGIYTGVYNGRDLCMYKAKKWAQIYDSFVEFCKKNNISFE